jgi:2-polyprenyl-3-methyl-5-hydroxy-6-metoxy-1,4-benzoquinol methylase
VVTELHGCRQCGSLDGTIVLSRSKGAYPVDLTKCVACGLVYYAGSWLDEDPEFYEYYAARIGQDRDALYDPLTGQRLNAMLRRLGRHTPGRRLLDVGCGEGHLVDVARAAGWDARGIDLSLAAVEICRSFGLDVDRTDFFDEKLPRSSFDVITMIELIEHVAEPAAFFARAEELLAVGGVLHLTTPNFSSLGRRLLGADWQVVSPAHLTYFSPRTMRDVVAGSTGLDPVEVGTRNLSGAAMRRVVGRVPLATSIPKAASVPGEGYAEEQRFRHRVEASPHLRLAKAAANVALRVTGTGEVLAATFRKVGHRRTG